MCGWILACWTCKGSLMKTTKLNNWMQWNQLPFLAKQLHKGQRYLTWVYRLLCWDESVLVLLLISRVCAQETGKALVLDHSFCIKGSSPDVSIGVILSFFRFCKCQFYGKEVRKVIPVTRHPAWARLNPCWFLCHCHRKKVQNSGDNYYYL